MDAVRIHSVFVLSCVYGVDRGFESHRRDGCCVHSFCVYVVLCVG
jgi:hypothetical protein